MRSALPLASFLFVASILNAQKITTFDVPGGINTQPFAISPSGDIVGRFVVQSATNVPHAFLRKADGTITVFDAAPGASTFPGAMSPSGEIAGYFSLPPTYYATQGFVRDPHGTTTAFSFPGTDTQTLPLDINPRGEVVGIWIGYGGQYLSQEHGFLREPDGTITTIDAGSPSFPDTWIRSINAAGQSTGFYDNYNVAGQEAHGFLREADGSITSFDVLNATDTLPVAINSKGQIAGDYLIRNQAVQRGFLRDKDGTITTFDVPGATPNGNIIVAIDSKGEIAGIYQDNDLNYHGFMRKADGTITTFDAPKATQTIPAAMNSRGEITGAFIDTNGHEHGFVLTQ